MKKERSAGGIIVRSTPNGWEILRIRDHNGNWTFPKGKIEVGEEPKVTAKREIGEEVGLHQLFYLADLPEQTYVYTRDVAIDKTVQYYLFRYDGNETPVGQKEEGISDPTWVLLSDAHVDIGYPGNTLPLILEVRKILSSL